MTGCAVIIEHIRCQVGIYNKYCSHNLTVMPNDSFKFPFGKVKKKKAAMREILDLTRHSLLAQRTELSKPSQALCKNWFTAFSTGFAHISKSSLCTSAARIHLLTVKSS